MMTEHIIIEIINKLNSSVIVGRSTNESFIARMEQSDNYYPGVSLEISYKTILVNNFSEVGVQFEYKV